jgi:CheY-like chemotaxis protein
MALTSIFDSASDLEDPQVALERKRNARTIVIVEDEIPVRRFAARVLAEAGYRTIEAGDGVEAENTIRSHHGPVDLVLSDIRMPGGNGLDLGADLAITNPRTPVLYMTGLTDSIAAEGIRLTMPEALLFKPFTEIQLLERVQVLLSHGLAASASAGTSVLRKPAARATVDRALRCDPGTDN